MTVHRRMLLLIVVSLITIPATAALSPELKEWGTGPAQWIMTSDEKKAWRKVATDSEAVAFIDLFWVRRDPTSGTAVNEYRNEFDSRVAFADDRFKEKRRRGAMTDRGRAYVVLGDPTKMATELGQTDAQMGMGGADGGSRQRGARDLWNWEYRDAQKFDMPKIEIVFVETPSSGEWFRDPHRTDFGIADRIAIKKAVTQPNLTAVPAWAPTGGLRPIAPITLSTAPAPPSTPSNEPTVGAAPQTDEPPLPPSGAVSSTPGVSRLTLLSRGSINARASADPFDAAQSATTFKTRDDAVWAVQYCPAEAKLPPVTYLLFMTGPLDGTPREQATKERDAKPERMYSQPGCYVIQGSLPTSKLTPGRYKLTVLIDDSGGNGSHKVKSEFVVE